MLIAIERELPLWTSVTGKFSDWVDNEIADDNHSNIDHILKESLN